MGLLFNLHWGFFVGVIIAVLILMVLSAWGEKLILFFARARYISDDEIFINQVKNFCCHCEIPEVKIYWSNVFVNNIYYTNSYFGKPTLIVGRNVYNTFSRNELNSLIYASLLKLKMSEAKHRTIAALVFLILYSPIYFLRLMITNKQAKKALDVFLCPAYFLKSKLYEKEVEVLSFDREVGKLNGLKKDYISALFKISRLPVCGEGTIGELLIDELNLVKNRTENIFYYTLIDHVSVEIRARALSEI